LSNFGKFFELLLGSRKPEAAIPVVADWKFKRDHQYESSPGIKEALAAIDEGHPIVLVVGRAGTGKTRLVQYLKSRPGGELQATVAPTGVAALNAQAQTIHSFFRFSPDGVIDARNLRQDGNFGVLYRRMNRLVIDEISMVRADLIDAIDARLRQVRRNDRPFGGVQLVMVGDFLQLPPIVQKDDWEILDGLKYRAAYAFSAHVLERAAVTPVILDRVWRQDEKDFVETLSRIRSGEFIEEAINQLNKKCVGPHRVGFDPLLLTARRHEAERYNRAGLLGLGTEVVGFRAQVSGRFPISNANNLPAPEYLELAVGARVMAAKNDAQGRWVNGSLGTVTRVLQDSAFVLFDQTQQEHMVSRVVWEKIKQQWNGITIESEVVGTYRQIPLIHGWAITIHKAQGLTLDDVRVDLGAGAFTSGQTYVALSRARTISGLSFARPLRRTDVEADPILLAFMSWVQSGGLGESAIAGI
jgi:ATP-dependent DNA helicase PIF1